MKTPREQKPDTGAAPAANDSRVFSNKGKPAREGSKVTEEQASRQEPSEQATPDRDGQTGR